MTLDEKIGQMTQLENGSVDPAASPTCCSGRSLSGGDGAPPPNEPDAWYAMVAAYQHAALKTRLGHPDPVRRRRGARRTATCVGRTIFPHNVGLGATATRRSSRRIGRATAIELAATGIRWDFGPVVAVPQDVRWGRTYEGYGEDTADVSELASAFITRAPGSDLTATDAAAATAKHFLGDGGTAFGSSTTNDYLHRPGRQPGRRCDACARSTCRRTRRRSRPARGSSWPRSRARPRARSHGDRHLLTDVLKGELGFSGFVVSDWAGVDQVDPDYAAAVAKAIGAGIDMVMVPYDGQRFQAAVRAGLASGAIDAVADRRRRVAASCGSSSSWGCSSIRCRPTDSRRPSAPRPIVRSPAGPSPSRWSCSRRRPVRLPIGSNDTVMLTGPGADDIGVQSGGWTVSWQGGSGDTTPGRRSPTPSAQRLDDRLSTYPDAQSIPADARANVGIVVLAEPPYAEGKGDSATLRADRRPIS